MCCAVHHSVIVIDQWEVNFCLTLRYRLQQQQESLKTTKEQVRNIKAKHQAEVQKNTKLEFSLRKAEEENFKLLNTVTRQFQLLR